MLKVLLLVSVITAGAVNASDRMIPQFQKSFYDQNSEKSISEGMDILSEASSQPATFGSDYEGFISSCNHVPYFIGLITSQRDNQNYLSWKKRLEQTCFYSPQGKMKSIAALALSRMGNKVATADLAPLLGERDNQELRSLTIRELGKSSDPAAISILQGILRANEVPAVQFVSGNPKYFYPIKSAAEKALKELGVSVPPGVSNAKVEDVIKQLGEFLNQDLGVALAAAHSLTQIGTPEAIAVLEAYTKEHQADNPQPYVISDINVRLGAIKKRRDAGHNAAAPVPTSPLPELKASNTSPSPLPSAPHPAPSKPMARNAPFPFTPVSALVVLLAAVLVCLIRRKKP